MNVAELLFSLVRAALCGTTVDAKTIDCLDSDTLCALYKLSDSHDIAHILGQSLSKLGLLDKGEVSVNFRRKAMLAVSRYEQLNYELNRICEALEEAQIPFVPLKGSVIRKYYPEPWMRTSCDIDVLVHEEDLMKAVACLEETLGYTRGRQGRHDIPLRSAGGVLLELHYDLVEDDAANAASEVLKNVWSMVASRDGKTYWQEMPDALYYFYHVAHMAKHIQQGGCGIRPFVDLWFLDNSSADSKQRDTLLKKGNLLQFSRVASKLSRVWLANVPHDIVTEKLENYIFRGGVYGTMSNSIAVQQQRRGGKLKYLLSKVFITYGTIKYHYPILQKCPWLMPVMQVRRWCKLVFCGHARRTVQELSYNQKVPKSQAEEVRLFLEEVGL